MKNLRLFFATIILSFSFNSCGGGGGGGSAGQQSVLSIVNATKDVASFDVTVDGEVFSSDLKIADISVFQSVLAGDRIIEVIERGGAQRKLELQNNFAFGIPYTLVVSGSQQNLNPIIAVNDRSDTPPAQFRIRAINASNKSNLSVKLIPGTVGRSLDNHTQLRLASPLPTQSPSLTASATVAATVTPQIIETIAPTSTIPITVTVPSVTPTNIPTVSVSPTATPNIIDVTAAPISNINVAENLASSAITSYTLATRGDYRITVESNGTKLAQSGVISFVGGQVLSILVREASSSEGGVAILRLNDKP